LPLQELHFMIVYPFGLFRAMRLPGRKLGIGTDRLEPSLVRCPGPVWGA
jgi:hypothetical protein